MIVEYSLRLLHKVSDPNLYGFGWVADKMAHMETATVTYPGDEDVPVPYADAMCYDPKGRGFPQLAMRCVLASAYTAGAEITPTVYEDVKRMAMGPEATDTYLDDCGKEQTERIRRHKVVIGAVGDIIDGASDTTDLRALQAEAPLVLGGLMYYGNALHTMPDQVRERIGLHAASMLQASMGKVRATNLRDYSRIARDEAAQYAHVWANTVWARQTPERRRSLEPYDAWLAKLLGGMLVAAAGYDLRKDYDNSEITFRPRSFQGARAVLMSKGMWTGTAALAGSVRLMSLKRKLKD
jgi:hypothetical protein